MELESIIQSSIPTWSSVCILVSYLVYLGLAGSLLPGNDVPGALLQDGTRLRYRCNGLLTLFLLIALLLFGVVFEFISPTVIADRGLELLSTTFCFSVLVTLILYVAGCNSRAKGSSLKSHATGNLIHDWWFGVQLNPHFMGVDLKFFFVRAGMMEWLFINLSVMEKSYKDGSLGQSMILYQLFCSLYILDYFCFEEYMTSTWDIIAERLGFMLVFGDLVWIPFTFSIQGWWLLRNNVELPKAAAVVNILVFLIGGVARHCNYLGDLLLALSFSLPCGASSPVPYIYPIYLLILLIWRERRDESRCAQKYREIWSEYCKLVPHRILPYVY
ncbi:delta(14)-sterol reductase-like isoform X2 [Papaver somniferum]|uniref:delta(14)-sterol reductase-like isoform X2 n=1 Tax=Papaver somniferum TaxID=3469 RepID=UPI000E6F90CA|nr:delta(14)-sterol reductase-like isoform X2 [Papaver somniferum]